MTAYAARTKNGPPENGRYQVGDTVPDASGTVWECVRGGMAGGDGMVAGGAVFVASPALSTTSPYGIGAANGSTVTAVETGFGAYRRTVLTLAATPMTIVDANVAGSVKVYDFPEGRILLLGCIASLAPTTTSTLASTLNASAAGVLALGSASAAADATLTSTEADMLPSTAVTHSATINVAAATVTGALAAAAQFNGTSTPIDMYLNAAITTATDIDGDATVTWSGVITFHWVNLGDF